MGAYNELVVEEKDHNLPIQFKYGLTFQFVYRVGDRIRVENEDLADEYEVPGTARDPVDGRWRFFAIVFKSDVIASYRELSEADFNSVFRA